MENFENDYMRKRNNLHRLRLSIAEGCLDKLAKTLSAEELVDLLSDINSIDLDNKEVIIDFLTPKETVKAAPIVEEQPNAFILYKRQRGL